MRRLSVFSSALVAAAALTLSVEAVAMPPELIAFVSSFVEFHHVEEAFVKRKRRRWDEDKGEGGKGDARIRQGSDVYRAPGAAKRTVH